MNAWSHDFVRPPLSTGLELDFVPCITRKKITYQLRQHRLKNLLMQLMTGCAIFLSNGHVSEPYQDDGGKSCNFGDLISMMVEEILCQGIVIT